ncbi:hypothetical protein BOTBODRAFT_184707 [Botryobasidium botryosum FD-172 SS1]|uniref:MYND-type domain-containing protein n=1 Tax=Botryobasidium botryosum (strain FD-172 SS1) TaxID=930990 RepID=A0A067MW09_BOTB1|nr:hypothetical protein BOTBODRAFT_184707 [Botryobasidium botryosum FD-172 SS1]
MAGYPSAVFEEDLHILRVGCCNWNAPLSPDSTAAWTPGLLKNLEGFTEEARRTNLHLAAFEADVLAACEVLRLGAKVDALDSGDLSPLALASGRMFDVTLLANTASPADKANLEKALQRFAWVVRILVEQHADVDEECNDLSILEIACSVRNWELVKLLLKHKAKPSQKCHSCFQSRADRDRFISIASSYASSSCPARVCPCWSGKTVPECHGAGAQPYPLTFLCVCGSKKIYQRCCHARSCWVVEEWVEADQRLRHSFLSAVSPVSAGVTESDEFKAMKIALQAIHEAGGPSKSREELLAEAQKSITELLLPLVSRGLVDPAFFYAWNQVDFFPKPFARKYSKHLCEDMQRRWNAAVDEYILREGDSRTRFEIERAAKIGTWNGALIRTCEGVGCTKVEGVGDTLLRKCAQCKISVYCGQQCQKSAWRAHKVVCGSDTQHEQMLPSQTAFQKAHEASIRSVPVAASQFAAWCAPLVSKWAKEGASGTVESLECRKSD